MKNSNAVNMGPVMSYFLYNNMYTHTHLSLSLSRVLSENFLFGPVRSLSLSPSLSPSLRLSLSLFLAEQQCEPITPKKKFPNHGPKHYAEKQA